MERIGKYSIEETIGKGGTGVVYRAFDSVLEREVAIKVQRYTDAPDGESVQRFFREGKVIASLRHRNIVTVYDLGQESDRVYIVMELLRGDDLSRKLQSRRHLSLELVVHVAAEVAEGLAHAHQRGIVHRDIKPRNVFITDEGEVKLVDFGLAHIAQSTLTEAGRLMGTPHYMSPEQVRGETADPRADIFALGAVFYELLTGTKAFAARDVQGVFDRIMNHEPRLLAQVQPALPRALDGIVAKSLAKRRDDRYTRIEEFLHEIRGFQRDVEQEKTQLRHQTREAARELARLQSTHRARLVALGCDTGPVRLAENAERADLSYMALVGLQRSASFELERMRRVVASAENEASGGGEARGRRAPARAQRRAAIDSSIDVRANDAYRDACRHFARGDLAGSLRLVGEVLSIASDHRGAVDLGERLRDAIIALVNRTESDAHEIDALGRAILALDNSPFEATPAPTPGSGVDRGTVETLSRIFLAGLPADERSEG